MTDSNTTTSNKPEGLMALAMGAYKGGLGIWLSVANLIILIATGLFIWCGFRFFTADIVSEQTFWGLCTVVAIMAQIALKQWVWLEISRTSIVREIQELKALLGDRH